MARAPRTRREVGNKATVLTGGHLLLGLEGHYKALEYILRSWKAMGVGMGGKGVGILRRVRDMISLTFYREH